VTSGRHFSIMRLKGSLVNIIWPTLEDFHHLYVWTVRILLANNICNTNICCAGMHKEGQQCTELIETTASALNTGTVALILLSVQKDNLELNIKKAVEW
jgi:hypothetical protein